MNYSSHKLPAKMGAGRSGVGSGPTRAHAADRCAISFQKILRVAQRTNMLTIRNLYRNNSPSSQDAYTSARTARTQRRENGLWRRARWSTTRTTRATVAALLNAPPTPAKQPVSAPKKAAQPAVTPPAADRPHKAGDLVTLDGLVSKPELNGREARITGYDEAKARFAVELLDSGTRLSLKGANLLASRSPASLLKAPSLVVPQLTALPSAWLSRLLTALLAPGRTAQPFRARWEAGMGMRDCAHRRFCGVCHMQARAWEGT